MIFCELGWTIERKRRKKEENMERQARNPLINLYEMTEKLHDVELYVIFFVNKLSHFFHSVVVANFISFSVLKICVVAIGCFETTVKALWIIYSNIYSSKRARFLLLSNKIKAGGATEWHFSLVLNSFWLRYFNRWEATFFIIYFGCLKWNRSFLKKFNWRW